MNKQDVLRHMHISPINCSENMITIIDSSIDKILNSTAPKTLYRIFNCDVSENETVINNIVFKSKNLSENLSGCKKVVVFGATLGIECDRLIQRSIITDTVKALALQASATIRIEEICDLLEEEIKLAYKINLRKRFSPGYGDLDICEQKKLFSLIELTKRIGITLTDTYEMIPSKSVTAFIGIDND